MSHPLRLKSTLALALAAVVGGSLALGLDALQVVLWFAPVLALALSMARGHYAGESLIDACRERRCRPRRRIALVSQRIPCDAVRSRVCRGRLIAHALAERGPPALAGCA
jgi:hypothetical protein